MGNAVPILFKNMIDSGLCIHGSSEIMADWATDWMVSAGNVSALKDSTG